MQREHFQRRVEDDVLLFALDARQRPDFAGLVQKRPLPLAAGMAAFSTLIGGITMLSFFQLVKILASTASRQETINLTKKIK
jgi:hypothetical protein